MPVHGLILARGDNIVSSHNDTQDVIMHVIPIAGSDPTSLCFCLFWFGCGCVFFVCLVSFVFGLWFFLAGTAHWTAYRSTTSTFVAIDK